MIARTQRLQALDPKKVALAKQLHADRSMTVEDICAQLNIGRSTLYRYLKDKNAVAQHKGGRLRKQ